MGGSGNDVTCNGTSNSQSYNILGELMRLFKNAAQSAYPEASNLNISIELSKRADYQCSASMSIAKVK